MVRPNVDLLPLLPVERDDETWTYRHLETGHRFAISCTQLLGRRLTPAALAAIEDYRHLWEPRGNAVHSALEHWLLHGIEPEDGPYSDWIRPLLQHPCWDAVTVIGVEARMFDLPHDIAGTGDVIVRYADGTVGAWDLKTKNAKSSNRQDVRPQLGFATRALVDHYDLTPSRNAVIWSYPGETRVETVNADECHYAWMDAVESYLWDCRPW